jgi:ABC-type multidrug transport system ATPase subunit
LTVLSVTPSLADLSHTPADIQLYHPGGVRVAGKAGAGRSGKESTVTGEIDLPRARITAEIHHLTFRWSRRSMRPFFGAAEKVILRDVSAVFPAGQVSAIIGPSGAGKSTILQLLAHREMNPGTYASFKLEGSMTFNGQPATKEVRSSIAFVEQDDDYHLSGLTVRETLRYAAILRLPEEMSRKKKEARAEEVLLMLGLKDCADVLVGGALVKGISGGEKRRLSLAVQMLADPSILVVDEVSALTCRR